MGFKTHNYKMFRLVLYLFERERSRCSILPFKGLALTLAILFILQGCSQENKQEASLQISHEDFLVLDAHLDTPIILDRPGFDISSRHDPMHDYAQIDLPRMREGGWMEAFG